ncbi:hypothetical protein Desaci_2681 [Desulfosporosinus acidiphilus SJ4]|uniref:Uncharacterized protein n=1 Tax=Desulfosporosinus acidiphilus (strain DSM 22704 / JCM 16185 / SJ4) TaxID=646529 RepID=I4D739_DESAJ|nr:hypothetical protein [Desulfosporosinus acidiphilus]AFM41613.1 hypothetical protein Desaci_2681 [Desulfosporosinus acidiphilus SJ4]
MSNVKELFETVKRHNSIEPESHQAVAAKNAALSQGIFEIWVG